MATTRRWYTLSLRTLLTGITFLSVVFAWQFYYRGQKVRERDRIVEMFAGRNAHVNFRHTILGWEVPDSSAWLWRIAFPDPESTSLSANEATPLPTEFCEIARRCSKVEYEGYSGGDDAYLRRCLSVRTRDIDVWNNGVSSECLAFVSECPNLSSVEARFVLLTTKSLAALLSHPRIERLEIRADADDFSLLGELPGPNALQKLDLYLEFDWRRRNPVTRATFLSDLAIPSPGDDSANFAIRKRPGLKPRTLASASSRRNRASIFGSRASWRRSRP